MTRLLWLTAAGAALAMLLTLPTMAPAQALSGPNHDELADVSWHVGHWLHRGRTEAGQPLVIRRSAEWALDGNYLTAVTVFRVEGEPELVWRHMVGWDSLRQRVHSWVFSSNGNFAHGVWDTVTDRRSVGTLRGLTPQAERTTATVTYTRIDDDTFIYHATNRTEGGQPRPDVTWRFHRVPSP